MKQISHFVVALILVLGATNMHSQSPLNHPLKMYKAKDGKLYVNKKQPMYLFLGTSPNSNSEKIALESESSPQYANPFYFDTEGYNTVRTPSQVDTVTKKVIYPITDIIFEVYADGLAPKTTASFLNSKKYVKDGTTYYNNDLRIKLNAKDQTAGVEQTFVSIDGQAFSPNTDTLKFPNEKKYELKYYSLDYVGNSEEVKSADFNIDKTPPVVNWRLDGDISNNRASGRSKILIMAEDKHTGVKNIKYQINDKTPRLYSSNGISLSSIPSGEYQLKFWAEDNVGNISDRDAGIGDATNVYAFIVDQVPPTVSSKITGDQHTGKYLFVSNRSLCELSAEDDLVDISKITYSINNQNLDNTYNKPFVFNDKKGLQSVYYRSYDMVANKSAVGRLVVFMDNEEPVSGIQYSGPQFFTRDTLFINKETTVKLFSQDAESGVANIEYRIDGGAYQDGDKFKIEESGFHKIDFRAKDRVNNLEQEKNSELVIDNEAPEIYVNFSIKDIRTEVVDGETIKVYPPYVKMYIGATDKYCGTQDIYFTVDGGTKRKYTGLNSPADVELFKAEKLYEVVVEANDKLGNSSTKMVKFRVAKK